MHSNSTTSPAGVKSPDAALLSPASTFPASHSYDCQECGAERHVLCQFCAEPLWFRKHDLRPWDAHGPTHHWCDGSEAAFASLPSLLGTPVAVPAAPEPGLRHAAEHGAAGGSSPRQAGQAEPSPQSETNAEWQQRRLREAML